MYLYHREVADWERAGCEGRRLFGRITSSPDKKELSDKMKAEKTVE